MIKFSQRIGKKPIQNVFQIDSMDNDLKNSLWNIIYSFFFEGLPEYKFQFNDKHSFIIDSLWSNFYKTPLDEIPANSRVTIATIKKWFYDSEWYSIYDLLEFFENEIVTVTQQKFKESVNLILEREMSGYRFINSTITPITNQSENY